MKVTIHIESNQEKNYITISLDECGDSVLKEILSSQLLRESSERLQVEPVIIREKSQTILP